MTCVLQAAIPEAAPLLRSYVATHLGPRGNEQSLKVKLGNYITENLAICIQAVLRVKPIQVLIEQPTSSSMFSLPVWETLTSQLSLSQVPTYLGSFGHFMLKPSVLLTNVYKTTLLHWQLNKKQLAKLKVKVQANKEKVEKKLGRKLRLISKCKGGVCGG